jgi:hypothetical protein
MNADFLRERRYLGLFDVVQRAVGQTRIIDILFENGMEFRNVSIHREREVVRIPESYAHEPVETISIPTADRQQMANEGHARFAAEAKDPSMRVNQPQEPKDYEPECGPRI